MGLIDKERLRDLHQHRRPEGHRGAVFLGVYLSLETVLFVFVVRGWPLWPAAPVFLALGHLHHSFLLAFHEAAHGTLRSRRWLNEVNGFFLGASGFISLELYRAAHHTHHAYLGTERDEELWPFVDPRAPRWLRLLAVAAELFLGPVFTPLLFLRSFLRPGTLIRSPAVRRRIWVELALLTAIFAAVFAAAAWWDLWTYLVVTLLVPGVLGSMMQSFRKYMEHMGMTGSTVLSLSRSVVPQGRVGRFLVATMFYEPYHGPHHQYPKLQGLALPEAVEAMSPNWPAEVPPFPTFRAALWDMLRTLGDPRIGPQWLKAAQAESPQVTYELVMISPLPARAAPGSELEAPPARAG